ncbi:Na+:solute symporter [bacterium]|nr:Na+:solute symporter [bacterium]
MESLQLIDYIVILVILVGLVAIGLYFTKKGGQDVDAFFVSGRSLKWYIAGTSMIATSFAADTPLWVSALIRSQGIHYVWQFWAPLIGAVLGVVYFARKWRRMGFVTDVEFVEARYGGTPAKVLRGWSGAWGAVVICPMISAWVIKAMETISREALGLPQEYQIVVTVSVVALAVVMCGLSGLFGVVYTDFIQFALATLGTVLLAIMSVSAVGGLDSMVEQLSNMGDWAGNAMSISPQIGSEDGQMSIWNAIGYFGFLWIGVGLCGGYTAQRLLASEDAKHASYAYLLNTVVYYALMAWPWILVGMCSLILIPELGEGIDQSAAYPRMIVTILPIGLRGLLVAALLAAFISTISTLFNWGSSYLVNDIYRRFIDKSAEQKRYVMVGRVATVFMAVVGAFISLQFDSIQRLLEIFYVLGSASIVPAVLRWFWWRLNGKAELIGMVVGWVMTVLLLITRSFDPWFATLMNVQEGFGFSSDPNLVGARMLFMVVSVGVAVVVSSYLTKPDEMELLKKFVLRARPFPLGWRPVIKELDVPYQPEEPFVRTMISWAISGTAITCILFGVGKLLLGPRGLGLILVVIGMAALLETIRRIRYDCRDDKHEVDTHDPGLPEDVA